MYYGIVKTVNKEKGQENGKHITPGTVLRGALELTYFHEVFR